MLKTSAKKAVTTAGVVALTAGAVTIAASPNAAAYNGREDPATGIVWGIGQDGSYMVPLKSGGEKQGWCIDPGAAYPKQPGYGSTKYGAPYKWNTDMKPSDKKALGVALILGKEIANGNVSRHGKVLIDNINNIFAQAHRAAGQGSNFIDTLPLPDNIKAMGKNTVNDLVKGIPKTQIPSDPNLLAAAVSGVVHDVGQRNKGANPPPYTKPWNPSRISNKQARDVFYMIKNYSQLIPNQVLPHVSFSIRSNEGNTRQRMVLMDDIRIDFDLKFEPRDVIAPPPRDVPGGPGSSTPTPVKSDTPDVPTSTTTPEKTTPGTTPETTPQTTPPSTTPKAREKTPEVRTSAGTKSENIVEQGATITDTVTYKNLEKGEKYRLIAETVNKENGQKDGNKGEIEFTPKTSDGRIDVPITLNKVEGDQLVVFETLEKKEKGKWSKVAEHADINDQAQTIGRLPRTPQIATSAESSTGNHIQTGTTVTDTVRYQGLTPGKQYRLEARLMCKATGADTGAVAQHQFTPETENGQTVVQGIQVTDPDCLEQVVFEKLYDDQGKLVATHEDINDAAQTFGGAQPAKKKKKKPAPKPAPVSKPQEAPVAIANAEANSEPAPAAPLGSGGPGGGGGGSAPRQTIGSVPSGESSDAGHTLFTR